jgi:hypothetical protein
MLQGRSELRVDLSELLALPVEERAKLAEAFWDNVARAELEPLIKEFVARVGAHEQDTPGNDFAARKLRRRVGAKQS